MGGVLEPVRWHKECGFGGKREFFLAQELVRWHDEE